MKKKEFSVQLEKLKESHQNQLKEHAIQEINAVQPVSRLEELLATRLKRVDAEWKRLQEDRTDLERSVQQRATSNERLTRQVASLNEVTPPFLEYRTVFFVLITHIIHFFGCHISGVAREGSRKTRVDETKKPVGSCIS